MSTEQQSKFDQKVFCIGFHKTGTTSMANALESLGYRVTGPNAVDDPHIASNALQVARDLVPRFDAFQDNPWPILYRELDAMFPGSKFILTTRDTRSWIASQVDHFGVRDTPMREWIYGVGHPEGNECTYVKRYERHNSEVLEHFEGRNDFLRLDVADLLAWKKLTNFLGLDVPDAPFPHANSRATRLAKGTLWGRALSRWRSAHP